MILLRVTNQRCSSKGETRRKTVVGKCQWKRPLGRHDYWWDSNTEMMAVGWKPGFHSQHKQNFSFCHNIQTRCETYWNLYSVDSRGSLPRLCLHSPYTPSWHDA